MANETTRPLKVFLCHASGDKPSVRDLYKRLIAEGVDAWLDQEKLLPGQDWRVEIPLAVQEADVVVVCLSNKSITKEGYIQKEIKFALDAADEKPDGTIFLIPARIEDCPVPDKLSRWHWVNLFEENGYFKLLRSLKLRAEKAGAVITPSSYQEDEKEIERRLEQLYTEGLAAFYTEDWDKACQRFQMILSERPSHRDAAEKLEEAENQRYLQRLYGQAVEAYQVENWNTVVNALEALSKKTTEYKDAAQLLRNAKKQRQLKEFYTEAKRLHSARKWEAVLKVFEQILRLDPNYPDPDDLLPSAQKELAELNRLSDLNALYGRALREMDARKWHEAKNLLEQVKNEQAGFLESDRLLGKVNTEIARVEEQTRLDNQINILYEQAHGLMRSKNWRKALEKVEEIRRLDNQFDDKEGVAEKAKEALELEDKEAQKQNQLAAMYAEAVQWIKEEKYQKAWDKWQEVRAIDPKYPDRQWVQRTAKRNLGKAAGMAQVDWSRLKMVLSNKLTIASLLTILLILGAVYIWGPRMLFFDDFDEADLRSDYIELSIPIHATPEYSFETIDDASVLRLRNGLDDHQRVGWEISNVFDVYRFPIRIEIRFNPLLQSERTSIDGFFQIWLIAGNYSDYYMVGLYAGNYGIDRYFFDKPFNFEDDTWYRLVVAATREQTYRASVYDDLLESELAGADLENNPEFFQSGMRIGIGQEMGEPGGVYPVDVAIDWIRVTVNPR